MSLRLRREQNTGERYGRGQERSARELWQKATANLAAFLAPAVVLHSGHGNVRLLTGVRERDEDVGRKTLRGISLLIRGENVHSSGSPH